MKKPNTYQIDWYTSGGWCYRTTIGVPYREIKEYRKQAKILGETIKVTKEIY